MCFALFDFIVNARPGPGKGREKKECMSKKTMEEMVKEVMSSHLKWTDYYGSGCFYYLAGRYPNLSINECIELIDMIKDRL